MTNTIVDEKLVSFKTLEQKIFAYVCELGGEITRIMLESYDREPAEGRDKKAYRGKGMRRTTIKTVYGEVEYGRHVYQTKTEDGQTAHVFLLDEAMQMDRIGLISTNLAEKIAMTVTESPYRVTADIISNTCGQTISAQGVWNMMQRLGERIDEEERHAVKQMETGRTEGTKELPYDRQGITILELAESLVYKHMGVQESQNCTAITMRMRWSVSETNNLAKALYRHENKDLINTIERYTDGLIFMMQMRQVTEILSAAKAPKKDGKGNGYADMINRQLPLSDAMQTASRRAFKRAFIG